MSLLADRLEELLGEVQRQLGVPVAETGPPGDDNEPLDTPVDEEFRVGAMGLAWDGDAELVVVEAQAAGEEPADESTILEDVKDGPDVCCGCRVASAEARAFVERARPGGLSPQAATVSAVRAAAGRERARLPAAERLPAGVGRLTHTRVPGWPEPGGAPATGGHRPP